MPDPSNEAWLAGEKALSPGTSSRRIPSMEPSIFQLRINAAQAF